MVVERDQAKPEEEEKMENWNTFSFTQCSREDYEVKLVKSGEIMGEMSLDLILSKYESLEIFLVVYGQSS